ncbi:MAG TPA: hypothetical protein VHF01_06175 [Candidatus Acidoferrum sp.]|nr:hypothetical protein [Candidatus Acidoferrum sp.]
MLLAAFLLLCPLPQMGDTPNAVSDVPATAISSQQKDSSLFSDMPSAPQPKTKTDVEEASNSNSAPLVNTSAVPAALVLPSAEPILPRSAGAPAPPAKAAFFRTSETRPQRRVWYALTFAGHGAAAFDAWSTRRAISGNYGTESNPLLRPFAHSGALYAATQVSPALMNYLGRRMMASQHRWVRKMWWLPQTAGTGMSLAAGVHNVGVVP